MKSLPASTLALASSCERKYRAHVLRWRRQSVLAAGGAGREGAPRTNRRPPDSTLRLARLTPRP